jgi:RNA polymerase sigma factor (sigma-70 family)
MPLTMSTTSRLPAHSEHELLGAVRAGNDRAFEELYARYRERIFSFILSKVHDHGRAEDIAQEVFMSALRRMRASDQTIAFKPWIYEIAKNACIDEFRRGSRAREVPLESDGEFVVDRQKSAVSAVPTPVAAAESRQRLDDLRGAFGGLSETHHQLLVMRELEGMSYDEIGARLDMSRQMVESSLFRARRKLNEEYQELASGRRCEQIQSAIDAGRLRAVSSLGLRDRRRFARHLSHCQPCRHAALMAGVDATLVKPRSIAARIAGLLPFPLSRLPWRSRGAKAAATGGSRHAAGGGAAGLASAGSAITFGQAAATLAVIVAGAGGGLAVHGLTSGGHAHHAAGAAGGSPHQASSTARSSAASSAAGAKTLHPTSSLTSGTNALRVTGSHKASTSSGSTGRRQRGSTPGTPGSGTSGGGSGPASSTPKQGTASSRPSASGTATKVVDGVNKTVDGVGKTVDGLGKTVSGAGKAVNGVTSTVTSGVNKTVGDVTSGVTKTVDGVNKTVGDVTSGVSKTVSSATNGAVDPSKTVTAVNKTVDAVTNGAASAVSGTVNGATGTATSTVGKVVSGLTGGSGGSDSSASSSGSSSGSAGSSSSSGSDPLAPVTSGVSGAVNGATQPVKSGLQKVGDLLGN